MFWPLISNWFNMSLSIAMRPKSIRGYRRTFYWIFSSTTTRQKLKRRGIVWIALELKIFLLSGSSAEGTKASFNVALLWILLEITMFIRGELMRNLFCGGFIDYRKFRNLPQIHTKTYCIEILESQDRLFTVPSFFIRLSRASAYQVSAILLSNVPKGWALMFFSGGGRETRRLWYSFPAG